MITSSQNPLIKRVLQLQKKRNRKDDFLVEGFEELKMAAETFEIEMILFCKALLNKNAEPFLRKRKNIIECSETVFKKISYRDNPDGILGIVKCRQMCLEDLKINAPCFFFNC